MKRILDSGFKYVPAAATDIRKTFERERKKLKAEKAFRDYKVTAIGRKRA